MYKWLVISLIVASACVPVFTQKDFWPFSSYSMFNSNLSNSPLHRQRFFQLMGVDKDSKQFVIKFQLVTGAIHPGMISAYLSKLLMDDKEACIDTMLTYWGNRYRSNKDQLPSYLRSIEKLLVVEMDSKIGNKGFSAEYLIK